MDAMGFPFSGTQSSSSSAATPSSFGFASTTAPSSSPSLAFGFGASTTSAPFAPSSSPSLAFGFGASTTSASNAFPSPSFGFATPNASAPSASPSLFGAASSSGSGFTSSFFGSVHSASTASSTGSPLFGATSFSCGSATSSHFGASTLFGYSTSSSSSGSTNLFGSGSSGGLFGSTTCSLGSSTPSLGSGFGATTTATNSSFSQSTKLPAAGSSTQHQSTTAAPLSGKGSALSTFRIVLLDEDEEVQGEGEHGREGVLEQPLVEMKCCETNHNEFSVVGQDQGGKSDFVKGEVACSNTICSKELEVIPAVVPAESILPSTSKIKSASVMGDNLYVQPAVVDSGKQQPSQDVAQGSEKICGNSSVVSEDHNEFSLVGQDQGGKSDSVQDVGIVAQDCESLAACSTNIHVEQFEAIPTVAPAETILLSKSSADPTSVNGETPNIQPAMVDMGKPQLSKDVAGNREETSETSSVISEVVGDEAGLSNSMGQAFSVFSHCSGLTNLTISPSDSQMIIKSIVCKHGDITKGSVVKSSVLRSTLWQMVAEVVHHLCNHTMNSLGSNELQLMQGWVDDAAAVGFSVDWLRERLKKVSAASKYHKCCVHLETLGEQINAAKKSLMEMELQLLDWKEEVDRLMVGLEGIDFEGSNLGEGLI